MKSWIRRIAGSACAVAAVMPAAWGQAPPAVVPPSVTAEVVPVGLIAPPAAVAIPAPVPPGVPTELPPPAATAPPAAAMPVPVPVPSTAPYPLPLPTPPVAPAVSNFAPPAGTSGGLAVTPSTPAPAGMPNLVVRQTLPETLGPGQPVVIDVNVSNTGNRTAEGVVLTGWWTEGYELTETSVSANTVNGRKAWGMGAIGAGEARAVKIKLTPTPTARPVEFRSGFDATFNSAVSDTRSIRVLKPELKLAVAAPETILVGQPVTLSVGVANGGQIEVKQAKVEIYLPDVLSHPSGAKLGTQIGEIAVGKDEKIPLGVTGGRPGEGKIKVVVTAPGCEPREQEIAVSVVDAKLAITMSGPKTIYQNWPATYEAVIENQSGVPLKGVTAEVKLPAGLAELRASDKPGYDAAGHRVIWAFDTLQPGEKRTVLWFGFAKQATDLQTAAALSVGGMPVKKAEWTTKNAGAEAK